MARVFLIAALASFTALLSLAPAAPIASAQRNPEALESQYEREKNPRKRAEVARNLMKMRLQEFRAFVDSGEMLEAENQVLSNYLGAVQRLEKAVHEAAHAGTSKQSEVLLREHQRDLEHMKLDVSYMERQILDDTIAELSRVREEVLYGIMGPRGESASR